MKSKLLIICILSFIFLSVQNGYAQDYKDLKDCFGKWASIMEHYTKEMGPDNELDKLSASCVELADSVTLYYPRMIEIRKKYPEIIESGPPESLKEFFTRYEMIESKYNEALNLLMKAANNNPENSSYQEAFGKLNMAIYNARR